MLSVWFLAIFVVASAKASALLPSADTLQPSPDAAVIDVESAMNASALAQESADEREHMFSFRKASSHYSHIFTDYLCVDRHGACNMPNTNHGAELGSLIRRRLPHSFHLLVYGPSYMREIGNAVYEHMSPENVEILGENAPTSVKQCHCGPEGRKCACSDYVKYTLKGGHTMTFVINYAKLQTSEHAHKLKALLNERTEHPFTHAMVMEPHSDCFFNKCDAKGMCPACEGKENGPPGYLGCSWASEMWDIFENHFGEKMVNAVPWTAKGPEKHFRGPKRNMLRTRSIAEENNACSADAGGSSEMSIAKHGFGTMQHQCYAVCKDEKAHVCSEGTPVLFALKAMEMLI